MEGTISTRIEGLGDAPIDHWMPEVTQEIVPPVKARRVRGGHSNLTYLLEGADGRRYVLRRPPLGSLLGSAHDVGRERRVMRALAEGHVPVPRIVAWRDQDELIGAPFFIMEHVDGVVLRTPDDAERELTMGARNAATTAIVETLWQLHQVDPDEAGLGELGRREQYVARQVRRWLRQLEFHDDRDTKDPVRHGFQVLADRLLADEPEDRATSIVHGDYKVDNLILSANGDVEAVLDWELCTLGDPLADVGLFLAYWDGDVSEEPDSLPPNRCPGFDSPDAIRKRIAARYAVPLEVLDYYEAFGFWKVAAITEGVRRRYVAGAYGDHSIDTAQLAQRVEALLQRAHARLDTGSG